MGKNHSIFCKAEDHKGIGESSNVNEKGLAFKTNMIFRLGDRVEMRIVPRDENFSLTCEGTVRHIQPANDGNEYEYNVGVEFVEGLKDFAIEQLVSEKEGITARKSMIINASRQDCYDAICNFESYPSWQKTVQEVKVLLRYPDSRPKLVEFFFDFIFKRVKIVNQYEYLDKDFILSWKMVEGDIVAHEGNYIFQKLNEERTNAIISGYIVLGFYAPKMVIDYLSKSTMRKSVQALKEVVEIGMFKGKQ